MTTAGKKKSKEYKKRNALGQRDHRAAVKQRTYDIVVFALHMVRTVYTHPAVTGDAERLMASAFGVIADLAQGNYPRGFNGCEDNASFYASVAAMQLEPSSDVDNIPCDVGVLPKLFLPKLPALDIPQLEIPPITPATEVQK